MKLTQKNAWGHLILVEEGADPLWARGPKGRYRTGEDGPTWWDLRCLCGKEFRIWKSEFPGRSVMRDCGPECPMRHQPDLRPRGRPVVPVMERKHMYAFSMTPELRERLRVYAHQHGFKSISLALCDVVEKALAFGEQIRKPNGRTAGNLVIDLNSSVDIGKGGR
jgi:hypothetical protein